MAKAKQEAQPNEEALAQLEAERKDREAGVLVGGPGHEPPEEEESATPSEVEMSLAGKKVKVTPEIAQLLEQREREFDRKLQQNSQELGELRKLRRPPDEAPSKPDASQQYDYETMLFSQPRETLNRFKQEVMSEITGLYRADKQQEQFWRTFYSRNNDLDPVEDEFMVQAVLNRHWAELGPLPPKDAQDRIADLTRQEILRLSQKFKTESSGTNRTVVESASSPRQVQQRTDEDQQPKSLSELIKKRQRQKASKAA